MSFDVAADAYDDFMGRYSRLLAGQMSDLADVGSGQRVLDVGCGPGALTAELVARRGSGCHVHHSFITRPDPGSLHSGLSGLRPRGGVVPARSQVRRALDAPATRRNQAGPPALLSLETRPEPSIASISPIGWSLRPSQPSTRPGRSSRPLESVIPG